ncbi:MAG TPA: AAA family ATPase [Dehalococcoidia bacterium]|nr:AAA family ATPase [Dehalococcoidia bacterium]
MAYLVVIYGAPFSGKTSVANQLARSLPGKSAVLSVDALLRDAIVVPDEDAASELEMVHMQTQLLTSHLLKNRYNVVVEGPFYYVHDDVLYRRDQDIDHIVSLMRNLTRASLFVRLSASEEAMRARATAARRESELEPALRIDAAYKNRYGPRALRFDTSDTEPEDVAAAIREELLHE